MQPNGGVNELVARHSADRDRRQGDEREQHPLHRAHVGLAERHRLVFLDQLCDSAPHEQPGDVRVKPDAVRIHQRGQQARAGREQKLDDLPPPGRVHRTREQMPDRRRADDQGAREESAVNICPRNHQQRHEEYSEATALVLLLAEPIRQKNEPKREQVRPYQKMSCADSGREKRSHERSHRRAAVAD